MTSLTLQEIYVSVAYAQNQRPKGAARKVAAASLAGNTIEYYDFSIYGLAAALVFPTIFFPNTNPFIATLATFATLAVGYFSRPLGAVIFGHYGDHPAHHGWSHHLDRPAADVRNDRNLGGNHPRRAQARAGDRFWR